MAGAPLLVLSSRHVRDLLTVDDCRAAVQDAFERHGRGEAPLPAVLGVPREGGGFHMKAGVLDLARPCFVAKVNANFPSNPDRFGLPTIQGVIVLADAARGTPLAVMDSAEITTLRTAAATAVAARVLARPDSQIATIIGCGIQGHAQLRALRRVLPLRRAYAVDVDRVAAERFARAMSAESDLDVRVATDCSAACRASDVVVTSTPARRPILFASDVRRGTFVAGVGADNPEKHEIAPGLVAASRVVTDVLDQAAAMGDLHHAIAAGAVSRDDAVELGRVLVGRAEGRRRPDEIVLFDSTGMALQDVAAAALVYDRAVSAGAGMRVSLVE